MRDTGHSGGGQCRRRSMESCTSCSRPGRAGPVGKLREPCEPAALVGELTSSDRWSAMPESGGDDLLQRWQTAMQSLVSSATSLAGRSEVPHQLLAPMQRQLELVQEVVERERRVQQELLERTLAPF